jgi:hypothetical protein
MHREPVFLSTVSLVEIEAAIGRVPASQQPHICALRNWLDGLISTFSDRIHLVDAAVAVRAGQLLPHCHAGYPRYRFHDVGARRDGSDPWSWPADEAGGGVWRMD